MKTLFKNSTNSRSFLPLIIGILAIFIGHVGYIGIQRMVWINNEDVLERQTIPYSRDTNSSKQILILGDSLAYGIGTSTPKTSFAGVIGQEFADYDIINKAEIGDATKHLAKSVKKKIDKHYDIVFIFIGGNDILRSGIGLDDSKSHLNKIIKKASENANQVFTLTSTDFKNVTMIPWFTKWHFSSRSQILRESSQVLANKYKNVEYIDIFDFTPKDYKSLEATDHFHLNDKGIKLLTEYMFKK